MKKWVILAVLGLVVLAYAQGSQKLWVHHEITIHQDRFYFVQDLETGTRCYVVTNDNLNASGYAIACVPQQYTPAIH